MRQLAYRLALLTLLASGLIATYPSAAVGEQLPVLGPAPDFTLTTQDNAPLSLSELHDKVVAISFIFTRCPGPCPILTAKLVSIQKQLGDTFGKTVFFLSVTVDPEYDRPDVLKRYADAVGSDLGGWAFLTGEPGTVAQIVRAYGVLHQKQSEGSVDHNLLTSLIDRDGNLRVQYMGERFDPTEFLYDLRVLMN